MKLSQYLNANGYEIRNVHVESIAAPAFNSIDTARLIYDSGILKYNNGSSWLTLATGSTAAATSSTLGTIQLAGDLAGAGSTATSPKLTAANSSITSMSAVATLSNGTLLISGVLSLGSTPVTVSNAAGNILTSALSGTIAAGNFPALTGDVTTTAGSLATTLAATTNGTLTSLTALTSINNAGALRLATNNAIGQATATNAALIFGGTNALLASNPSYGISLNTTLTPDSAQNAIGVYSNPTIATSAATTYPAAYGVLVPAIAKTGTGTVTNAYGIYSNAPTAGATNYAGYFSGNVSVVGNLVNTGNLTSTGVLVLGSGPTTVSNTAGNLLASALTGTLPATSEPAHTGDVTNSAGSLALALVATTNGTLTSLTSLTSINTAGVLQVSPQIGVGGASVTNGAINIVSTLNPNTNTNVAGIISAPTITLNATAVRAYGEYISPTLSLPTSGAISGLSYAGIQINNITNTGGATAGSNLVANMYGINIIAQTGLANATVTNAYGLYINSPTAGATLNYSIYANGPAPSFLGGALTVAGIITAGSGVNAITNPAGNVLSSNLTGQIPATTFPVLTGDVTTAGGSLATTLAATTNATLLTLSGLTTINSGGNIRVGTNVGIGQAPVGGTALGVTGSAVITGTITAGSGANVLTTVAGLIDATKLTGAASGLSSVSTTGDITVGGNLNITGQVNSTTVNTLSVSDYEVTLANTASTAQSTAFTAPGFTSGALQTGKSPGLSIMRYSAASQRQDMAIVWNESIKRWQVTSLKSGAAATDVPTFINLPLINSASSSTVNPMVFAHNLNTAFPVVTIYETSTSLKVEADVTIVDNNTINITFGATPSANQYTVVVLG